MADETLRAAVHGDAHDAASPTARLDLHAPRTPRLRGVRVLDSGRDDRLRPFVALDRPDAQAVGALPHLRPPLSPVEHAEGRRQVGPQHGAPRAELGQGVPHHVGLEIGLDGVRDPCHYRPVFVFLTRASRDIFASASAPRFLARSTCATVTSGNSRSKSLAFWWSGTSSGALIR